MRKGIAAAACILVALLSACATSKPKVWYKDGGTAEQFGHDKLTCQEYGMQSAQTHGLAGNGFVDIWINSEAEKCLKNLGYHQ